MKKYEKTQSDTAREESDLKNNAIMRWLQNQDAFKFTPGDVLIKKTKHWTFNPHSQNRDQEWVTEVITKATGAPKKYVYAFENKLGIGYIRQLKANGTGYCGTLICVANFDPENTRFELDPDYLDHTIIGEGEFEYNNEYVEKKKFRQEAMEANKKLLIKTSSKKGLVTWFLGLKVGDVFWYGGTFDDMVGNKYRVANIIKGNKPPARQDAHYYGISKKEQANDFLEDKQWQTIELEVLETNHPYTKVGSKAPYDVGSFHWMKVCPVQPYPMRDPLCGPPK